MKSLALAGLLCLIPLAASAVPAQGTAPGTPFRVGGDVSKPQKISGAPPVYTYKARKARIQGVVILEAVITESGDVSNVHVLKALPYGLDGAAIKAVSGWKFKPALKDGIAVPVYYTVTVTFQVGEPDDPFKLLLSIAEGRANDAPAPDAARIATVVADLAAGRSTLPAAAAWAQDYKGESRSALLIWVGGEASRRARMRPADAVDSERASLLEIGLVAENAAIANEGTNAQTWNVAEAKVYKHLLLTQQAATIADPQARFEAQKESYRPLAEARLTYNALTSAAARAQARATVGAPPEKR